MILVISRCARDFRGILNYCLDPGKAPELVAGNMAGEDARGLAHEFRDAQRANEAVRNPVFHASLSCSPEERLAGEHWRNLTETFTERMGYGNSLWVAIRHRDTHHDHLHIISCRVGHDGSRVRSWLERFRGEAIVRDLEREHGLRQAAPSRETWRLAPGYGELMAFARSGKISVKARLQELVELSARGRPAMGELAERLEALGIGVKFTLAKTGRVAGISYELDGVAIKGSNLGQAYTWGGLQERKGVSYEPDRDLPALRARSQTPLRAVARPARRSGPRTEPMPKLDNPVRAFRDAAVLASRIEVHERARKLDAAQRRVAEASFQARQFLEERERTARRLDRREQAISDRLARAYEDPYAAAGRLRELIATRGYEQATQVLGGAPDNLGRLRGVGFCSLRSETRAEAIAETSSIARELRDIGNERARFSATGPQAAKATVDLETAQDQARRLARMRHHLPDMSRLEEDLLSAAQALGARTVKSLSGIALGVVSRVAKKKQLAQQLARDPDRSLGR